MRTNAFGAKPGGTGSFMRLILSLGLIGLAAGCGSMIGMILRRSMVYGADVQMAFFGALCGLFGLFFAVVAFRLWRSGDESAGDLSPPTWYVIASALAIVGLSIGALMIANRSWWHLHVPVASLLASIAAFRRGLRR